MNYPDTMDPECILLCDALNALPGITTTESCCGHGEEPFRIFFMALTIENLLPILRVAYAAFDREWYVDVRCYPASDEVCFMLSGPVGAPDIPDGANDFAAGLARYRPPQ